MCDCSGLFVSYWTCAMRTNSTVIHRINWTRFFLVQILILKFQVGLHFKCNLPVAHPFVQMNTIHAIRNVNETHFQMYLVFIMVNFYFNNIFIVFQQSIWIRFFFCSKCVFVWMWLSIQRDYMCKYLFIIIFLIKFDYNTNCVIIII